MMLKYKTEQLPPTPTSNVSFITSNMQSKSTMNQKLFRTLWVNYKSLWFAATVAVLDTGTCLSSTSTNSGIVVLNEYNSNTKGLNVCKVKWVVSCKDDESEIVASINYSNTLGVHWLGCLMELRDYIST